MMRRAKMFDKEGAECEGPAEDTLPANVKRKEVHPEAVWGRFNEEEEKAMPADLQETLREEPDHIEDWFGATETPAL